MPDALYDHVILLLHGDGANNGTVITDDSPHPYTPTSYGVVTSTADAVYGQSMYFDGASYVEIPTLTTSGLAGDGYNYWGMTGSPDFCIEVSFCLTALSATGIGTIFCDQSSGSISGFRIYVQDDGSEVVRVSLVGKNTATHSVVSLQLATEYLTGVPGAPSIPNIALNQWVRVRFSQIGTTLYGHINGVMYQSGALSSAMDLKRGSTGKARLGANYLDADYLTGYVDELRFTLGNARGTGVDYDIGTLPFFPPEVASGFEGEVHYVATASFTANATVLRQLSASPTGSTTLTVELSSVGGAPKDLGIAATSVATVSASLRKATPLSLQSQASATVTATLGVGKSVASAMQITPTAGATLGVLVSLGASLVSTATTSAALGTRKPMASSMQASSTCTAQPVSTISLATSGQASSTVSAGLGIQVTLLSNAAATSSVTSAALSTAITHTLVASIQATSSSSANIQSIVKLAGSMLSVASSTAGAIRGVRLDGASVSVSTATAHINKINVLKSDITSVSTSNSYVNLLVRLAASIQSQATSSATVERTQTHTLANTTQAAAATSADIHVHKSLSVEVCSVVAFQALVDLQVILKSISISEALSTAELKATIALVRYVEYDVSHVSIRSYVDHLSDVQKLYSTNHLVDTTHTTVDVPVTSTTLV